jgi:hypothetical protein
VPKALTRIARLESEKASHFFDERGRLLEAGWPRLAFVERRLAADQTNWWLANDAAVEAMLRSSGLEVVARPAHETYVCRPRGDRRPIAELRALG